MADVTIGELEAVESIGGSDLFVVQQDGFARKVSGQVLLADLAEMLDGHGGINRITGPVHAGTNPVVDTYTIVFADETSTTFTVTNGLKGDTGQATYVWVRYSSIASPGDEDLSTTPSTYIGVYTGPSSTAPTTASSYQPWFKWKGETGDAALVTNSVSDYQASNDGTVPPSGTWTEEAPVVSAGNYLWTRTTITFTGNQQVQFFSAARQGLNGNGSPATETPLVDSGAGVVGSQNVYAREDHQHPLNVATSGYPEPLSGANGNLGEATTYARSDHAHPASTLTFSVSLVRTAWSNGAQTVSNANFVDIGYVYYVFPATANRDEYTACKIYADDVSSAGSMTFHCGAVQTSGEITVNVVREVSA